MMTRRCGLQPSTQPPSAALPPLQLLQASPTTAMGGSKPKFYTVQTTSPALHAMNSSVMGSFMFFHLILLISRLRRSLQKTSISGQPNWIAQFAGVSELKATSNGHVHINSVTPVKDSTTSNTASRMMKRFRGPGLTIMRKWFLRMMSGMSKLMLMESNLGDATWMTYHSLGGIEEVRTKRRCRGRQGLGGILSPYLQF